MTTLASPEIRTREIRNFVGGKWQKSTSAPGLDLTNPATGEPLGQSPSGSAAEVDAAVAAAHAAFPAWRATPAADRIQFLFKLKAILEDRFDELAAIITTENGKTLANPKANCAAASRMSKSPAAFPCSCRATRWKMSRPASTKSWCASRWASPPSSLPSIFH